MPTWIDLSGGINARDVGGIALRDGGSVRDRALLRSGNLQSLTSDDITLLVDDFGLTDVVDLRTTLEVRGTGPGPMTEVERVTIHHHSYFLEDARDNERGERIDARALPWNEQKPSVEHGNEHSAAYLSYVHDRPDSVLAALRAIAYADGATLVHCAAGKDRTGTTIALALLLVGAEADQVVADYAASSERSEQILANLIDDPVYHDGLVGSTPRDHDCHAETMQGVVAALDAQGGPQPFMSRLGWTADDQAALQAKLVG